MRQSTTVERQSPQEVGAVVSLVVFPHHALAQPVALAFGAAVLQTAPRAPASSPLARTRMIKDSQEVTLRM